jgi:hypothetical protein
MKIRKGKTSMENKRKLEKDKNSIEVIFNNYEEVKLTQNGFIVTFENKSDVLEAFKALTRALDQMDKEKNNRDMGFEG